MASDAHNQEFPTEASNFDNSVVGIGPEHLQPFAEQLHQRCYGPAAAGLQRQIAPGLNQTSWTPAKHRRSGRSVASRGDQQKRVTIHVNGSIAVALGFAELLFNSWHAPWFDSWMTHSKNPWTKDGFLFKQPCKFENHWTPPWVGPTRFGHHPGRADNPNERIDHKPRALDLV